MHSYFPTHKCVGFHSLERKHVQRAAQLNELTVNVLDGLIVGLQRIDLKIAIHRFTR